MSKKFVWMRNGALIGLGLVASDLLFEWRGPKYLPSNESIIILGNLLQMLGGVVFSAIIGFAAGAFADRNNG
jgi:hypothetical protein